MKHNNAQLFDKILCHKDYLTIICGFLRIRELFGTIVPISTFHINFINNVQQKRLVSACINNDIGSEYLKLLDMSLKYDNTNEVNDSETNTSTTTGSSIASISYQMSHLFGDWQYVTTTAISSSKMQTPGNPAHYESEFDSNNNMVVYNMELITKFQSFSILQYWILQVS